MVHEAFFALFAMLVVLLNVGVLLYAYHSQSVTVGEAVSLITLVGNAYTPIAIFNVIFVQYKLDRAAYRRFEEFMDSPDDAQLSDGKTADISGEISISGLSFQYGERKIFENLDLHIVPGTKVAFVGESGSGKTTLLRVLSGLTKYEEGHVCMDGQELKEIDLDSLYAQISYISQDSPVFDGTLRENMVFDREIDDAALWAALKSVQLNKLAEKMPDGLNSRIGERGAGLSGGEKQRLALSRLWFENKRLILLDEVSSAMDNLTEKAVMREVLETVQDSTVIAVAHRLSSIADFDRIIVFSEGKIVGDGTYAGLMENNEYFQKLSRAAEQ